MKGLTPEARAILYLRRAGQEIMQIAAGSTPEVKILLMEELNRQTAKGSFTRIASESFINSFLNVYGDN